MVSEADGAPERPARTSVWRQGKSPGRGGRKSERRDQPEDRSPRAAESPDPPESAGPDSNGSAEPAGLGRDRITDVSVRLLDTEGLAKFSMRRLAAELGVTAMSLYWYVDTKDDLLELALDDAFGEVRVPDLTDEDADWRDQLRELAAGYRTVLVRHPWISPLVGRYLNIGPRSTVFSSAVQGVIRRTGLAPLGLTGAISAVFQFVYGFGTIEGHYVQRCAEAGVSQDEYYRRTRGTAGDTVEAMRQRDFTFALDLLIAGIEAMRARE
jgi:AcrR family transcriptional regulator